MCERLLNLQEIYVSDQNICIEVYGNSVGTITPLELCWHTTNFSNAFVYLYGEKAWNADFFTNIRGLRDN